MQKTYILLATTLAAVAIFWMAFISRPVLAKRRLYNKRSTGAVLALSTYSATLIWLHSETLKDYFSFGFLTFVAVPVVAILNLWRIKLFCRGPIIDPENFERRRDFIGLTLLFMVFVAMFTAFNLKLPN